ncbi:hypothetical protein EIP91_006205 [Steccherinum ochraceum]|uniref:Uncharacterized protein n=1 Tax=Steccherinum ochraceum TaxID=92696 RepID=A0A4R0R6B9_9APHY|nr:hypothetical protein EIP91_006205 [Steccherinum ochraceum]
MPMSLFSSKSSSNSSKRSSMSSTASPARSRMSISSNSSGVSYFVQFPFSASRPQVQRESVQSLGGGDTAEMMDDDNMAWGKPRKSRR